MAAFISKRKHMYQLQAILEWRCKDEREKLGEKQQKAHHWVTLRHNEFLKSSRTRSWQETGEWVLTPHCKVPGHELSSAAAHCPFLPTQLLMHFSGGTNHCCLVSLLLINNLVSFANKCKILFKNAAFGILAITNHVGYQGCSRGPPKPAGRQHCQGKGRHPTLNCPGNKVCICSVAHQAS